MTSKSFLSVLLFLIFYSTPIIATAQNQLQSPDRRITVGFNITDKNAANYTVSYNNEVILPSSEMGIIRKDADFSNNLKLEAVSEVEAVVNEYTLLHGKKKKFTYNANRRVFHLSNAEGEKMDVIFQVSNDGVAFRYFFPDNSDELKKIDHEVSTFNFTSGTTAWLQPMSEAKTGWSNVNPSYEENYIQNVRLEKIEESKPGWVFPALFQYRDVWMLLSETAPDRDYCGSRLQQKLGTTEFHIAFPDSKEVIFEGTLNPESKLPWETPWRIIAIGDLKTIVESTLGTDLAKPSVIEDISWIKPGRASWSWVLLKDDLIVYDVQKKFIDYSAEMRWEYCLIDVNWDTKIGYDKIRELADYAAQKNVGLILWYNSAGDWNTTPYHPKSMLLTHESRKKEFARLQEMGIKGIKVDFFGGDGQSVMTYYQDIFEDAAKFNLLVNCHGSTIPRGWQRTYPNLVTMEAVKGFEFVTFEQANADQQPTHSCLQPFTRNVFDPMDFTPVCFSEVPNIERRTTNAFELALAVIFHSGVQHYAEIPEMMAKMPEYVRTALREIPVSWDETQFVDGYPGKFVVLARKAGETWYVAGINGEANSKDLELDLSFLAGKKGILISDDEDNRSFKKQDYNVNSGKPFDVTMKANGGFLLRL